MDILSSRRAPAAARCDLLVVVAAAADAPALVAIDRAAGGVIAPALRRRRFKVPGGPAVLCAVPAGALGASHVLVIAGTASDAGSWRAAADATVQRSRELGAATAALLLPDAAAVEIAAETLDLAAYTFQRFKSKPQANAALPRSVTLLGAGGRAAAAAIARGRLLARAACYARDLVNLPADVATPSYLAEQARRIARQQRLRLRVYDERAIRRLKMGALLGVARGTVQPPRFIEIVYRPPRPRRIVALVGKGITFDSGGLSLKNADSMQSQKRDMAGGAVVLGVMSAIRDLAVPIEVRGYVPATENMPSGSAIKPGDVVRALNGTTIEVLNTDAEGRLVLADALAFACRAKPDVVIDFATLTAAVRSALGSRYAAVMSTEPALARALIAAAERAGEKLWELPLVPEYRSDLDSGIADIKNTGSGQAGTIIGGLFLREFVGDVPWAHIDFSSTAVAEKPFPGHPAGPSGFAVRTILRYLSEK